VRANSYSAIPTVYRSIRFRSRLEARWASLLDLLKVEWEYEPFDLGKGKKTGYIPDFLIQLKKPTLLECKPIVSAGEFRQPQKKISKSGWVGPAIIVGSSLYLEKDEWPEITARATLAAGTDGWSRVGRTAWPSALGTNPFDENLWTHWTTAGNGTQWAR
jgi:hypothetical protein